MLAGNVVGLAAQLAGLDVKATEIRGMSQRGGTVTSEVRFGKTVHSPMIPPPGANYLLAFELLEGLRAVDLVRPGGTAIVSRHRTLPATVTCGAAAYPDDAEQRIEMRCPDSIFIDALDIATGLGTSRAVNSLLIGVLATRCGIALEHWQEALRRTVNPRFVDPNVAAFETGYRLAG